jgi:hypothetical protein
MLPLSPLLQRQESDLNTSTAPNAVFAAKPAPSGKKKNNLKPSVRKRIGAKKKGQFNKYYDKKKAAAAAAAAAIWCPNVLLLASPNCTTTRRI